LLASKELLLALLLSFAASAVLTYAYIHLAARWRIFDVPGGRRLHTQTTLRGGGAAFVLISAFALAWAGNFAATLALLFLGVVSFADDVRALSARLRLLVHVCAALLVMGGWAWQSHTLLSGDAVPAFIVVLHWAFVALAAVALVASINVYNFMDGANGMLGLSTLLVLGGMALLADSPAITFWLLLCAAALAGFVPYNFPHARVFMGDVGSTALGLLVGVGMIQLWPATSFFLALMLPSAFITDATLTLLQRCLKTRRWYTAHRSHLYQWLIRMGHSHTRVSLFYAFWTLLCLVLALFFKDASLLTALKVLAAVYASAALCWFGIRFLLVVRLRRLAHA